MNTAPFPAIAHPPGAPAAARQALKLLQKLRHGTLTVRMPSGEESHYGNGEAPRATIHLHNWRVCAAALKSGDIGFAESYMAGDWSSNSLPQLLQVFLCNRREVEAVIYGHWLGRAAYRLRHWFNRNHKANSAKNIHAHYDLGNAFYALWLDDSMSYSSALFDGDPAAPLRAAQDAKLRRALRMSGVQPGERLLEVGCGWGALAQMARHEFKADVVGVTLSPAQLALARERNANGSPLADLRLQDYRDIADAPFDAICSIEMIEAVGRAYWPRYFESLARLLKPGKRACVQSIVIADSLFERYISSTDFIQQYIFPGGCLPCPREFKAAAQAAGLQVVDELAFGADYAETLRRWRERFMAEKAQVLQLGFDERFVRTWEFYLAYCEAAFTQGDTDVVQYTLQRC